MSAAYRVCIRLFATVLIGLLAGCAVGPDFARPPAPTQQRYLNTPLVATTATPEQAAGASQHVHRGGKVNAHWWRRFHSAQLDALERQALKHSPTLAAARDALRAAHEQALAGHGAFWPNVDAGVSASRNQDPHTLGTTPSNNAYLYNLFTPQLSIGYSPDVFGLARRQAESLDAQAEAARFAAWATYNTLTSNVAATAIQAASLQAQVRATEKLVEQGRSLLRNMRYRMQNGAASGMDVAAQKAQLAQVMATLPELRKQEAVVRHRLAVLCGRIPGTQDPDVPDFSDLHLPQELPLSLPSQLVEQRPDVRQAQAAWHAASAAVGVAEAERLPHIELTADAGRTSLAIAHVFTSGTGFWNLAAGIAAPLFEGGALKHQAEAARADEAQAAAQYRQTVLAAFEDVADVLVAIKQDALALTSAATASDAAKTTLDATRRKLRDGAASSLDLVQVEQAWQQARIGLIQARAERYTDTVALFQALGGGWHKIHTEQAKTR